MRILKSMRRRFGAPTTVLFGFSFGLDCFAFRSNVPEVITGSSATTKTVHIATCTAQQSWTRCIRFRTRKLRKRKRPFTRRCNCRKSWRDHGFFHFYLPCSLTPSKYLRALYWFCSDAPQKQILKETGLKVKVWVKIRNVLRSLLWLVMQTHAGRVQLGGQTDRVVVVDETFFTKKEEHWRVCWSYHAWSQDDRHGLFGAAAVYSQSHWCLRAD